MTIAGAWICGRRMERLDLVLLVNLILVLGPVTGAFAQQNCSRYFEVGGAGIPWTIQSNPDFYQNWSASIQFLPGDCLWFDRVTDGYVYDVTTLDYSTCNSSNPLAYFFGYGGYVLTVGPFPVSNTYPQSYLFVEANVSNCMAGMKFNTIVNDPASVPPPAAPSPTTNAPTSPPPPPMPLPPISPPGPPAPTSPPLKGQPEPTTESGTSSKLSVGAIAGIAVAFIASAVGVGGGIALKMDWVSLECCIIHYHNESSGPMEKNGGVKEKPENINQNPQIIDQP